MPKKRVVIIMPALNSAKTLEATAAALPPLYDEIVLCDDGSSDGTHVVAENLKIPVIRHEANRGYGGAQKTLFNAALEKHPDIIIMVHPDNQYSTACLQQMIDVLETDPSVGLVLGSRMETALKNKMPSWRYVSNRFLTACQNTIFQTDLSEFHSGLRAYRASALTGMPRDKFSDDFVFDSEIIAWLIAHKFSIKEVPTECYYTADVSSIGMSKSVKYGLSTLGTLAKYSSGYYKELGADEAPITTLS